MCVKPGQSGGFHHDLSILWICGWVTTQAAHGHQKSDCEPMADFIMATCQCKASCSSCISGILYALVNWLLSGSHRPFLKILSDLVDATICCPSCRSVAASLLKQPMIIKTLAVNRWQVSSWLLVSVRPAAPDAFLTFLMFWLTNCFQVGYIWKFWVILWMPQFVVHLADLWLHHYSGNSWSSRLWLWTDGRFHHNYLLL
jgi:hypothetical protein